MSANGQNNLLPTSGGINVLYRFFPSIPVQIHFRPGLFYDVRLGKIW